jgi:hypothetical protein
MGEFRPPYHGGPTTAPIAPYGYPGDQDMDPHHTPTSSGGRSYLTISQVEFANLYSSATLDLPVSSSHRDAVASNH